MALEMAVMVATMTVSLHSAQQAAAPNQVSPVDLPPLPPHALA